MNSTLRPMTLGEILDRAIQMFKANFSLCMGIGAVPALVSVAHDIVSEHPWLPPDSVPQGPIPALTVFATFVLGLANIVLEVLLSGAASWAAARVLLGEPVTVRAAYGAFRGRRWRLLGIAFLQGLYSAWPIIPMLVIVFALPIFSRGPQGMWSWIVVLIAALPCLPLYARYVFAYAATAVEDTPATLSIRRSVELGRGYRWKAAGAALLPLLLWMILSIGTDELFALVVPVRPVPGTGYLLWYGLQNLIALFWAMLFPPLTAIALTLTYFDLRIRKEGFDIVRMLEEAALPDHLPNGEVASVPGKAVIPAIELDSIAEDIPAAEKPAQSEEPA